MHTVEYYLNNVEAICPDLKGNVPNAWKAFSEKMYDDANRESVKQDLFMYSREPDEDFKNILQDVITTFCANIAKGKFTFESLKRCSDLFGGLINNFKLKAITFFNHSKKRGTFDYLTIQEPSFEIDLDFVKEYEAIIIYKTSERERNILNLYIAGYSHAEIAEQLKISKDYIKTSIYRTRQKLNELKNYLK